MCAKPSPAGSRKKIAAPTASASTIKLPVKLPKLPTFTKEEYMRDDETPPPRVRMTLAQWYSVERNPSQKAKRDNRVNLKHLQVFTKEHCMARMGIYPDGRRTKLDCHTRIKLYVERPWLVDYIPKFLTVECFPVRDDQHAAERFKRVDNRKTAKNAADDVHGSFRLNGIPTESGFFQNASNIKSPLQYAYEIVVTSTNPPGAPTSLKAATIDDCVIMFKDALIALDTINVSRSRLKAPFITAFLLAYTKHGADVIPFFTRVNEGTHGRKIGKRLCPIAAAEQKRDKWDSGGRTEHMELVVQVLGALDTFMKPANFRDPEYQPDVNMQKIMEVDLDLYMIRARAKRTGRTLTR